ncbi:MAG: hypothetical protein K6B73_05960 [Treponema sp.]|nr:hypothetical protein [Treponema sp.]
MSESDKTNELDSYGVWVKTPPKTIDSSTDSTASQEDSFNIDTDLPDFSDLDVIDDTANMADAYDNDDTALSAEELSAITQSTSGETNVFEDTPAETPESETEAADAVTDEEAVLSGQEEEISLDEFITDGVFETGPDEDKIREKEAAKAEEAPAEEPAEEEVSLDTFGMEEDNLSEPAADSLDESAVTEETAAESNSDDIFDIDLSFDDAPAADVSKSADFAPVEDTPVSEEVNEDNPAGTESVDLSEFGLDDFSSDDSDSSSKTASDDGMESVDLSEFGIDESAEEETPAPSAQEENSTEETPSADASEPAAAEDDFTVVADDDDVQLEADSVTEATPEAGFTADGDDDFDVDAIMGDVTDENGNTVSIGSQEDSLVREVADIPEEDAAPEIVSEEIEDLSANTEEGSIDIADEIPDTFEEETSALLDDTPVVPETTEANAAEFAETIKAPILEESEVEEKPSTQMTAIFDQIVGELSSLKTEIASLKTDLETLKNNNAVAETAPQEENTGFFSGTDEDDTIALSSDELDNILNTADVTEAPASDDMPMTDADGSADEIILPETNDSEETVAERSIENTDEIEPESELPEESILGSAETDVEIPDDDFSENSELSMDFANETLEEPALDEINIEMNEPEAEAELPDEISVPKTDDILVESSSTDLMDSVSSQDDDLEIADNLDDVAEDSLDATEDYNAVNAPEPTINDTLTDEKLDYLAQSAENDISEKETLPGDLKTEIKSVLSYMDQLLENLPEDKIAEFAKSEQFDTYKKLFKELGLA